jgi:F0F1-type ATP synthase assembly protein I
MAERQPNDEQEVTPPEVRDDRESASWHKMAGIGVEFIVAVGLLAALGWWLDGKFGTSPWLLIAGCGLGFTVGLYQMVKAANRMMK